LAHDSLFARFCGLARIPSDRTIVNWLKPENGVIA
jgi:hypothetical protein